MKVLKYFLLGSAVLAPINACSMISLGKSKAALVWCIAASVESILVILIDVYLINKKLLSRPTNRGSRIYD